MSRLTRLRYTLVFHALLALVAQGQGKLDSRAGERRFVSEKYEFSMAVPRGWRVKLPDELPLYFNYPDSRALPQGRLPDGGAYISVVVSENLSGRRYGGSLSQWAVKDMHIETHAPPPSPLPFAMPRESDAKNAIELSYDSEAFERGQQQEHEVAIYWEYRGRFFNAHLSYVAADPSGAAIERVFLDTVRSFRPIQRPGAPP